MRRTLGLHRRKLSVQASKISISSIVEDVVTSTADEGGTTDFEPYVLSDVEDEQATAAARGFVKAKHEKRRGRQQASKSKSKREHKSKTLYARIAQCGQNVALNNVSVAPGSSEVPQIVLKETYLQCPFNEGHHVPSRHFRKHVRACQQKLAPKLPLQECPFNSNHLIPVAVYAEHVRTCRDQAQYMRDIANSAAAGAQAMDALDYEGTMQNSVVQERSGAHTAGGRA